MTLTALMRNEECCIALSAYDNLIHIYPTTEVQAVPTWLLVGFSLFFLGLAGIVFNHKNFLVTMMFIECMYLGVIVGFVFYGLILHDTTAMIYGLLVLVFAACESAVGLGLLVSVYRYGRTIGFSALTALGG